MEDLDNPNRIGEIRAAIEAKPALKRFYTEVYARYAASLAASPNDGLAVELGSGGGFAQRMVPGLITTDILPYQGIDCVVDATLMPFKDHSVRFFGMLNVFHHIPDIPAFLREVGRCLVPGGRLLVIDQHAGWISTPVLKYLHHEPFLPDATEWRFETTGPLSGANGALAWIVFLRDRAKFVSQFPDLHLLHYRPFAPLVYWMAGGLKPWCLLPPIAYGGVRAMEQILLGISSNFGSFVQVEIERGAVAAMASS
jgi:SAM-dependent methyltransferase